jgi:long-subunit fatty acid transport protein
MMNPLVTAYGQYTFDQAIAATAGDPVLQGQITALRDGLTDLGQTDAGNLTLQAGQATYTGYSEAYLAQGQQLLAGAFLMGDQEGDITQTGTGITPIIGANFTFMENDLSIGLRYEFKTKLELENEVPSYIEDGKTYYKGFITGLDDEGNPVYMFPNGAKTNADIPAMLSVGVDYRIADPLKISLSYHTYFDKNTGWAEDDKSVDNNFWEFGGGLEYSINENFLISAGYLRANTGVNQAYQSNLSYSLSTNTVAAGGAYKINDMFTVNVGGYYVMYEEKSYDYSYTLLDGLTTIPYVDTYTKSTFAVAVGLDIAIGAKK